MRIQKSSLLASAFVVLFGLASVARANQWTSPDGNVAFDLPADGSMILQKNTPAGAAAEWETADGTKRLIFAAIGGVPDEMPKMEQVERGSLKALPNSTVVSKSQTTNSGIPQFTITLKNPQGVYMMQTILALDGKAYKLIAAEHRPISADASIMAAFNSIKILDPSPVAPGASKLSLSSHDMSVRIAEIGICALVVGLIFARIRRSRQREVSRPRSLPPRW